MIPLDKPNMTLPLVPSYNERGIAGFTNTVTNGIDQRRVNCIYRMAHNAVTGKATIYLSRRPGVTIDSNSYGTSGQSGYLVITADTFVGTLPTQLPWVFSVSGNDVRVSTSGATTVILTSAGRVPVFVDKTAVSGLEYIVLQMRTVSSNAQRVFYAAATDATTWTEITDADFTALTVFGKMVFMDGFTFILDSNSRVYNSDLNSLSAWTATNYIAKQIVQDSPAGLARLGNQIIAFGRETMEVFRNAGNATASPLEAITQLQKHYGVRTVGIGGTFDYYTVVGERLYFAGAAVSGLGTSYGVFVYDGSRVEKISTPFIDSIISEVPPKNVQNTSFLGMPAIAFALDLAASNPQRWLMFFPEWNEWFEWNSTVFSPICYGGSFLGVGSNQHKLYTISTTDNWQDNGTDVTMTVQFKLPKNGNHKQFVDMMGVSADTAAATTTSTLNVELSRDDYQTFETARGIDLTSKKKHITRCGSYEGDLAVRLTHTANLDPRLEKFLSKIR